MFKNLLPAATLSLGIAASTAIFSFVRPLLLNPFTYPHPSELITIELRGPKGNPLPATLADYQLWKQFLPNTAAFDIGFFFLTDAADPNKSPAP
jgi:hypothetical protein